MTARAFVHGLVLQDPRDQVLDALVADSRAVPGDAAAVHALVVVALEEEVPQHHAHGRRHQICVVPEREKV